MSKGFKKLTKDEKKARDEKRMNDAVAKVLEKMESGETLHYVKAVNNIPEGVKLPPCWGYSFLNRLIIASHGTADARTFKQWKDVGRSVIKGERAKIFVYEPVMIKKTTEDEETGEEKTRSILIGFRLSARFAVEQTEGEPVEYPEATLPDFPMIEVARRMGLEIRAEFFEGRSYGSYNPVDERIILRSPDATTFYHEVGHHLHNLILKAEGKELVGGQDDAQEIIAELVGGCLANMNGVAWSVENIAAYVKGYNGNAKRVAALFPVVEKCIDLFMEKAEEFGLAEYAEEVAA